MIFILSNKCNQTLVLRLINTIQTATSCCNVNKKFQEPKCNKGALDLETDKAGFYSWLYQQCCGLSQVLQPQACSYVSKSSFACFSQKIHGSILGENCPAYGLVDKSTLLPCFPRSHPLQHLSQHSLAFTRFMEENQKTTNRNKLIQFYLSFDLLILHFQMKILQEFHTGSSFSQIFEIYFNTYLLFLMNIYSNAHHF